MNEDIDEDEDSVLPPELRIKLRQFQEELPRRQLPIRSESDPEFQEEVEQLIQSLLTTPEAVLSENVLFQKGTLGDAIVRLLALLAQISPFLSQSRHEELLNVLVNQVNLVILNRVFQVILLRVNQVSQVKRLVHHHYRSVARQQRMAVRSLRQC